MMIYAISKSITIELIDKHRFRIAQLLFILSIAFSWYIADGYRRGLLIASLLLLDKQDRKIDTWRYLSGLSKIAAILLLALGVWVLLAPLLGGVKPLFERISGLARPVEIIICCIGTLLFARDLLFEKYFLRASLISAIVYFLLVFTKRLLVSFSTERSNWIFDKHAAFVGVVLVSLLPWILYTLSNNKEKRIWHISCAFVLPIALFTITVTYYRTIWLAAIAQFCVMPLLNYYMFAVSLKKVVKSLLVLFAFLAMIGILFCKADTSIKNEIYQNIYSFTQIGKNFETFSSKRGEIWEETIQLISIRKMTGYGWIDYNDVARIKKNHPHSSYLQAAFNTGIPGMVLYICVLCAFEFLALKYIITKRVVGSIVYVVALMVLSTAVAGLTESYFFTSREYLIPFWSTLTMLLSPVYINRAMS